MRCICGLSDLDKEMIRSVDRRTQLLALDAEIKIWTRQTLEADSRDHRLAVVAHRRVGLRRGRRRRGGGSLILLLDGRTEMDLDAGLSVLLTPSSHPLVFCLPFFVLVCVVCGNA